MSLTQVSAKMTMGQANRIQTDSNDRPPPMLLRLFAAFVIIPLVELVLLLRLSEATSPLTTIAIVIVTGLIGSYLARREGLMAWTRFQSALAEGRLPSVEIQDGLMVVFAAALLLTPGLLTDALGFTLLTPVGRSLIRRYAVRRFFRGANVQVTGSFQTDPYDDHRQPHERSMESKTIDVEAVRRESE